MAGHYTLRVFNETESDELHRSGLIYRPIYKYLIQKQLLWLAEGQTRPVRSGKRQNNLPTKPMTFWFMKAMTMTASGILPYGNRQSISVDGPSLRHELDWAINSWASDASELVIFFVDHGFPDNFIIYADGEYSQQLNVDELDDWLDNLQQNMVGPITFIYDACHSGTFASKLVPPTGKDRIIITGASDEPAYFRGEDSFSFQFWEQIFLNNGNLGSAFSGAADIMLGYQTALINANGNSLTNEAEDITSANGIVIRRGQPIYLKPAPSIGNVLTIRH